MSHGKIKLGIVWPSRPVCIDPMSARLAKTPMSGPKSKGENKAGNEAVAVAALAEVSSANEEALAAMDELQRRIGFTAKDWRAERIILIMMEQMGSAMNTRAKI